MELPFGAFALLAILLLVAVWGWSIITALIIADAAGKHFGIGLAIGVLLPIIGPLVWGIVEYLHLRSIGYSSFRGSIRARLGLESILWWLASCGLLLAVFFPWTRVKAKVDGKYEGDLSFSPWDSVVGAFFMVLSAVVILIAGAVILRGGRRRLSILVSLIALPLLFVSIASSILYGEVSSSAASVAGWSGHTVDGDLIPGTSIWITLSASLCALAGSALAVFPGMRGRGREVIKSKTSGTEDNSNWGNENTVQPIDTGGW